ncbi:hypothetical protein AB6Q13_19020 [Ralstonia solanacearum]|uniref:hypothetical protein n=1 Tax=Ralstonia solanacearum TaxID=305 RepID=UPI002305F8AA|nr:hypothetical protein [Ralstonia solanacearum]MDB0564653.1 hypothetical protein [Ralstonia solanacearum]MDB0577155.1 hypothetical protein [Ralstonia solanacearum]
MKYVHKLGYALPLLVIGSVAHAADAALDLSPLTSGMSAAPIITGILAAAGVLALVVFAKFGAKKVVGFFGS